MSQNLRIAVIGGGSWATALVKILLFHGERINWYMRNANNIEHIKKHFHNPNYLSSITFDVNRVSLYNNIPDVINNSDLIIFAIPAPFLESALDGIKIELKDKIIVSAIKGIIPGKNQVISDFFKNCYNLPAESYVVISGPCHAEEVAQERLSFLTIASKSEKTSALVAGFISNYYIQTIISDDVYGIEYSAVLKNIFAIAAGICHGLRYGDNFQAVLISSALQEIERFVNVINPLSRNISASAYLGDLLVTAYSQFSRNRTFGTMIGKGYSVKFTKLEMNMIAEGYYAVKSIKEINKEYKVEIPISESVYNILYENISPSIEMKLLADIIS